MFLQTLHLFAQAASSSFSESTTLTDAQARDAVAAFIGFVMMMLLVSLPFMIVTIIATWKVYAKAGKPGWASIVPIYNTWVMLEIAGKPTWWILLFFVPLANLVVSIMTIHGMVTKFGKDVGFTILTVFFPWIGIAILGFGSAQYEGGSATQTPSAMPTVNGMDQSQQYPSAATAAMPPQAPAPFAAQPQPSGHPERPQTPPTQPPANLVQ